MPLIKTVLKSLAKSVLITLGLTAATSATDATIQKKIFGSSVTVLIISNEEMNYILKTVTWSIWLIDKNVTKAIKKKQKNNKADFWVCC